MILNSFKKMNPTPKQSFGVSGWVFYEMFRLRRYIWIRLHPQCKASGSYGTVINSEKGISLIELVVAVSIFSLVMLAATGIFINAMKAQKAIIAKQNLANNMRYAMEFMAKELRMAQVNNADPALTFKDNLGGHFDSSDSPSSVMSFYISGGNEIKYRLDASGKIMREDITAGTGDQKVSSDEISIVALDFKINDWDLDMSSPSPRAPLITIYMKAGNVNGAGGEIELQTSVSPRTY